MDHVVYLDTEGREIEKLINDEKSMIIRGATGRKFPYERVFVGDMIFYINK